MMIAGSASASDYLGQDGPFERAIEGYQVRQGQLELCAAIEEALDHQRVLTAEAGTGIGKTFAYLIPAVLSGKRVIISTGTRHLQDQLYRKDLPRVLEAMNMPIDTALLKGRSNYLCHHRLSIAPHSSYLNREARGFLSEISAWAKTTEQGDIAELTSVPEDHYVWPLVTSTAENCLGGECEFWKECHVVDARKQAQDADIVVINHHLLLADMALKQDGFAELLPQAEAFIIDEAHQLHDVASRFFGNSISSRMLILLAKDAIAEQLTDAADMDEIREQAEALEKAVADFRLAMGDAGQRGAWHQIRNKPSVNQTLQELAAQLDSLSKVLELAAERGRGLEQCYERSLACKMMIARFIENIAEAEIETEDGSEASHEAILWFETWARSFMLHATPIDISSIFREHTDNYAATWLFTSATLQVDQNFDHFSRQIGLQDHDSGVWQSPFDYAGQSLLYLPDDMPQPSDPSFTAALIERARPVLEASDGKAFLLFTSYRAMYEAAEILEGSIDYPMFVQGKTPKHQLLEEFRAAGNGILLGTASFWEGVDVRGSALSCVIIDKLPFASPGDPVMQARIDAIKKSGGSPFMDYQVPQAVIALKQGVGRLIRDVNDHGVVLIGDPRITQKSYGEVFLNSLPPMKKTRDLDEVVGFFERYRQHESYETTCT